MRYPRLSVRTGGVFFRIELAKSAYEPSRNSESVHLQIAKIHLSQYKYTEIFHAFKGKLTTKRKKRRFVAVYIPVAEVLSTDTETPMTIDITLESETSFAYGSVKVR